MKKLLRTVIILWHNLSRNVKKGYLHQHCTTHQRLHLYEKTHKSNFSMSMINNIIPVYIALLLTDRLNYTETATSKCGYH